MATTSYGTPYVQSSDLVSGWPNASLNVANRIDEVSYAGNGINAQTGTTYTLVVGDAGKTVTLNNAAAVAVTLPQDSVANLPTGAVVNFYNLGAGTVTISAGAGATLQGTSITLAQYSQGSIIKLSANTYGPNQAGQAPGMGFITSQTFSSVSAVNVNNCFTSTYENYRIMFRSTGSVSNRAILRLRASGTDATTGYAGRLLTADGTGVAGGTISATYWPLMNDNTSTVAYSAVDIFQPQETTVTGFLSVGSTSSPDIRFIGGRNTNTTSYDGFSLIADTTGNITGTVYVYGYRKA